MQPKIEMPIHIGKERNAAGFDAGQIVFTATEGKNTVAVVPEHWNEKQKSFSIYFNGTKWTASSNLTKAIGEAILILNGVTRK